MKILEELTGKYNDHRSSPWTEGEKSGKMVVGSEPENPGNPSLFIQNSTKLDSQLLIVIFSLNPFLNLELNLFFYYYYIHPPPWPVITDGRREVQPYRGLEAHSDPQFHLIHPKTLILYPLLTKSRRYIVR